MSHKKDKEGSSSETNANVNNISVTNRQLKVRPFQINENRNETALRIGKNGYAISKDSFATSVLMIQR